MEKADRPKRSFIMQVIMGSVIAMLISLLLSLLFSLLIAGAKLGDGWYGPLKQVARVISIFLGSVFGFKGRRDGWKKGLCLGLIYSVLAILIFSLIDPDPFTFSLSILWDILLGIAMGLICGIITVNLKKA